MEKSEPKVNPKPIFVKHETYVDIREAIFDHIHESLPKDVQRTMEEYALVKSELLNSDIFVSADVKITVASSIKPRVIDTRLRS